ncbi:MAG TPA: DegV family protein [Firmicutes bacterium]|nr:DegV family protein [Bacillota bacterium]
MPGRVRRGANHIGTSGKKIRILTDSTCDLDKEYLDSLGVSFIPMKVSFGQDVYLDRVTITPQEFYAKLRASKIMPSTSQISPPEFEKEFRKAVEEGYHLIAICFSSQLSGTYQSACVAKDLVGSDDIDVVDSRAASVGLGLIVREAALMANRGEDAGAILERVDYMVKRMEHIFAVGSLEMLKRGGRISAGTALIGTVLNIHPILQFVDGCIVPCDKVRGKRAIVTRMLEIMEERGYDLSRQTIGLNYAGDTELYLTLKRAIEERFGVKQFLISEIGATIGSHVGEGTVSVFFLRR